MSDKTGPTVPDLLREYGEAIRGDWSDIDGRSVRSDMDNLAGWIEAGSVPAVARNWLGICPLGKGHWVDYCRDYHCNDEVTP